MKKNINRRQQTVPNNKKTSKKEEEVKKINSKINEEKLELCEQQKLAKKEIRKD